LKSESITGTIVARIDCRYKICGLSWHPKLNMIAIALDERESRDKDRERDNNIDDIQRFRDKLQQPPPPPSTLRFFTFDNIVTF
jgi:hypothetical protein